MLLDSSALVKLVVEEPESEALRRALGSLRLVASEIVVAEVRRAAIRRDASFAASADLVLAKLDLRALTRALLRRAGELAPATLRTLDAIHLATALELRDDLDGTVVYDLRLAQAMASAGLAVLAPGVPGPWPPREPE